MSTITDRCGRALRFLGAASLALVAWFGLVALATLTADPTRTVAVFAPASVALRALAHGDALLVGAGAGFVIVRGQHKGFVGQLYAGGAWLVLPASTGGCRGSGRGNATAAVDAR